MECEVQSVECKGVECRRVKCGVWIIECDVKCGVCGVQSVKCGV